ncbi:DUF6491 family protein [Hyphococcus sp.]|uniref:DUF6491 family protein n=1 Tax=Hyphococcus sp. TaxID=2038636 RepID=UPI003CCBDC93
MKNTIAIAGSFLLAAGCASAGTDNYEMSERVAERLSKFTATGETETCLSLSRIRSITPLDERHFLVEANVGDYYLNRVSGSCFGAARPGNRIQYTVSGGQLCRNEIINVVDNTSGIPGGSCGLGSYERLEKVETQ